MGRTTDRPDGEAPYEMAGVFVELCDCQSVCPCWIGLGPDDDRCTGIFGWAVDRGQIDGVGVDGCRVVSVSFHTGHRDTGDQRVAIFVDEGATDEQYALLVAAFTGLLGGPLGELQRLMGVMVSAEQVPIHIALKGRSMTLTVGRRITGDGTVVTGGDGEVTELHHGRLSEVLGPRAEVGRSSSLRVRLGDAGFDIHVTGRSAMRGRFRYEHDVAASIGRS